MRDWTSSTGGCFTPGDVDGAAKVVVLGQTVAQQPFGDSDPVGQVDPRQERARSR